MTSRHTRRNAQGELVTLSNQELARLERTNRQQQRPNNVNMGDYGTPEQVAASMQQMRQEMQQMQEAMAAQQLAAQQAGRVEQHVPIGERNLPRNIPATRSAIAPPACQRADFEIKPGMINLVQRKMFHGLPAEIPMEHIEAFEEICGFTRANGVPPDFIKCMLFPFSLADKASRWLKSLPTGSLTSWEQVRAAFLDHFYTKAKTAALRNKITSFKQLSSEPFNEAWERFNDILRDCPHHGFDDDHVLGIFYDGVAWEFRNALNAASNGDFMTQTTEGANALIENMAASASNKNEEIHSSKKVHSMDTKKIDDLAAKMDQLLKHNQNQIYVLEEASLNPTSADTATEAGALDTEQQEVSYDKRFSGFTTVNS